MTAAVMPLVQTCPWCKQWVPFGHVAEGDLHCPAYDGYTVEVAPESLLWELACTVVRERQERAKEGPR